MKIEKFEKLIANLHNKSEYVIHIRINHGMVLGEKNHRVIKSNQNAWLKPYIDMNTALKKETKINFEKDIFKLIIMEFLEKLWARRENMERLNLYQQEGEQSI